MHVLRVSLSLNQFGLFQSKSRFSGFYFSLKEVYPPLRRYSRLRGLTGFRLTGY